MLFCITRRALSTIICLWLFCIQAEGQKKPCKKEDIKRMSTSFFLRLRKMSSAMRNDMTQMQINVTDKLNDVQTKVQDGNMNIRKELFELKGQMQKNTTMPGVTCNISLPICETTNTMLQEILAQLEKKEIIQPDGLVHMRGNSGLNHLVYREITKDGTWLVFGPQNQNWNYTESIANIDPIVLLRESDIEAIADFTYSKLVIDHDIDFYCQADDSYNPSYLKVSPIDDPKKSFTITMGPGANNAQIYWDKTDNREVYCTSVTATSNTCGQLNKPMFNSSTDPLFIWMVNFRPTDTSLGATAIPAAPYTADMPPLWRRNKYTWTGTKYLVKIKLA